MRKLILASASPRRQELLHLLTDDFDIVAADCDENIPEPDAKKFVCELALKKAKTVFEKHPEAVVIGSDTVVCVDGKILGKPKDRSEAEKFIRMMQGKEHHVYTGVAVVDSRCTVTDFGDTVVTFEKMTDAEICAYLDKNDYGDKAGGYAIQGAAARFIKKIEGCYYNVMGLPVSLLYGILKKFNIFE